MVTIDGKPLSMEVDTGAAVSLISEEVMRWQFPSAKLQPSTAILRTYTGQTKDVVGELLVNMQYRQQSPKKLNLVVAQGSDHVCLVEIGFVIFRWTGNILLVYPISQKMVPF